jgi:sec-independent protein translocase protein TatB
MFDIGWGELVIIGIVALIAIGPKELPGALRTLGQWMGKVRRMAGEFQHQFNEAMREAEMADLKKQVDTLTSGFDPIETARKELETALEDKPAGSSTAVATPDTMPSLTETSPGDLPVAGGPAAAGEPSEPAASVAPGEAATEKALDAGAPGEDAVPQAAGGRPA